MSIKNQLVKSEMHFSEEEVALIKSQIAPKASNDELKLFLYQCKKTGLDPFAKQIYAIHRWNSTLKKEAMTIQTSIDGFRVIAERSGYYAGQGEPIFEKKDDKLLKCSITIYRFKDGMRYEASVGVAYWNEYVQTNKDGLAISMWAKMPHTMLSKVAEAIGLRKAFPQDLSGIYTNEEMDQSYNTNNKQENNKPTFTAKPLINNTQLDKLIERLKGGEVEVYQKAIDTYSFESSQMDLLEEAYNFFKSDYEDFLVYQQNLVV